MQYLLLIYDVEAHWAKATASQQAAMYQEYGQLIQQLTQSAKYRGGSQLEPTTTATTVRVRNHKCLVTDGPFAET